MKTIIFLIILSLTTIIFADNLSILFNKGIPIGDWSYELNTAYGFGIEYSKKTEYINFLFGGNLISYSTDYLLYRVNILHLPIGIEKDIFENNKFAVSLTMKTGISIIEKRILENYERGFNEFLSGNIIAKYNFDNFGFSIYTGLLKEKIIEGQYYIYLGTSYFFNIN